MKYGAEWMFQQVRMAAGIHMTTFKSKDEGEQPVKRPDGTEVKDEDLDLDGSLWHAPPSFLADMRRAQAEAGVYKS